MTKNITNSRGEYCDPCDERKIIMNIKQEPNSDDIFDNKYFEQHLHDLEISGRMRRSMSLNDIAAIRQDMSDLGFEDYEGSRCYQNIRSEQGLVRNKFVSLAEAVYHFETDIPGRYHSKPSPFHRQQTVQFGPTIPQSPFLRCRTRSRPLHILSQKEREEQELEEIKKFKLKAQPVPKSVINGSNNLPQVSRKPATKPEPFNLTEVPKKIIQSPRESYKFKARPVPKHIIEKSLIYKKTNVTPDVVKVNTMQTRPSDAVKKSSLNSKSAHLTKDPQNLALSGPVIRKSPQPFSFEKRNEELRRLKEERIKRQIEEERKQACIFKAQPLPNIIKKKMQEAVMKATSSTTSDKENCTKFEARPAVVLQKKPFVPVLRTVQTNPAPFDLCSEKRAKKRENFERRIKEKELEMVKLKQKQEQEQLKLEEKQNTLLRAQLVHHAKPAPSPEPFIPEKSDIPLTVPETPLFVRRLKQH